eukprot:6458763-Amphidinium_carterae.2
MLDELRADICAVQETRLELPEDFETKELCCSHSPAVKGRGGLLIALRKQNRAKLVSFQCVHHRILTARFVVEQRPLKVISAHAPVRDAPVEDHSVFQLALATEIRDVPEGCFLVVCADLNARLGNTHLERPIAGPWTSPLKGASHIENLLVVCQERRVYFLNTLLPPLQEDFTFPELSDAEAVAKAIVTWKKPVAVNASKQPAYQIDFILGNQLTYDVAQSCAPLPWA